MKSLRRKRFRVFSDSLNFQIFWTKLRIKYDSEEKTLGLLVDLRGDEKSTLFLKNRFFELKIENVQNFEFQNSSLFLIRVCSRTRKPRNLKSSTKALDLYKTKDKKSLYLFEKTNEILLNYWK